MLQLRKSGMVGGLLTAASVAVAGSLSVGAADKAETGSHVAHTVYFKLKDRSEASRAKLTASCKSHLNEHDGTISFATGTVAADLKGPYNDQDFDVSVQPRLCEQGRARQVPCSPAAREIRRGKQRLVRKDTRIRRLCRPVACDDTEARSRGPEGALIDGGDNESRLSIVLAT